MAFPAASKETELPAASPNTRSAVVLQAHGLKKAFGGQVVLAGVDLEMRSGQVVLLRGDNGSGKTTLLNILTGNLIPDAGFLELATGNRRRVFRFPQPRWRMLSTDGFSPEGVARAGVSRSWQEVRLFGTQTLCNNIAVAFPGQMGEKPFAALFQPFRVRAEQQLLREQASEALAGLGLADRLDSTGDRISLGQARRVSILRAVRAGTRILFLDEPLAGLDETGRASVMALLEGLAREHKLTLVVVEHVFNIPRILDLADTVWTLSGGRLTVEAPAAARTEMTGQAGSGLLSWLRAASGHGGQVIEERLPGGAVIRRMGAGVSGEVVLNASDLVVHRGGRLVLGAEQHNTVRGVSFTLHRGELAVLQAPNGWGKTTLFEALAGLLPLTCGTVRLMSHPLETKPAWDRRVLGLTLLQARNHTFPNLTVREALHLANVETVPGGLEYLLARPMSQLSGGEKQKVALACALQGRPYMIALLDEPFSALDFGALDQIRANLAGWLRNGAVLIALPATAGNGQDPPISGGVNK